MNREHDLEGLASKALREALAAARALEWGVGRGKSRDDLAWLASAFGAARRRWSALHRAAMRHRATAGERNLVAGILDTSGRG